MAGLQVVSGGKVTHTISPADVVRVDYGRLPGMPDADRLRSAGIEGKAGPEPKDVVELRVDVLQTATERTLSGISDSLLRLSVGLEDVDDLLGDFSNALNSVR